MSVVQLAQGSDEWKAWRREGLGSSDVSAALGLSRWKAPMRLWEEKTGLVPEDEPVGEFIAIGTALESGIRNLAARNLGVSISPGACHMHDKFPWLRASTDGMTEERFPAIVECKNITSYTSWRWGSEDLGECPPEYRVQVLHQLMVTGAPFGWLVALISGSEIRCYRIERDREAFNRLFSALKRFWERVETKKPPAIDETEASRDYLKRRYPSPADTIREATPKEVLLMDDLRLARLAVRDAKKVEALLANRMVETIGNDSGIRGGSEKVTYKPNVNGVKSLRCPNQWSK